MSKETESIREGGIPSLSVGQFVDALERLYTPAIHGDARLRDLPSVFLWGPPGVGKSDGVRELAARLSETSGKRVCVTDVRLLLFSPVDLRGVPVADATRSFTDWLRPRLFDLDPDDAVVNLLFLDELSAAPLSVQAAAYQITLERRIGEHELPENTLVIAAGNRTTDRAVAFRMPSALANRLMHFEVSVDFASWEAWSVTHHVHPLVLGYLSFDSRKLCAEEVGLDEVAYPTPRSWTFVSQILHTLGDDSRPEDAYALIAGCIGAGLATEFVAWCRVAADLPSVDGILAGRRAALPERVSPDLLCALIAALSTRIATDEQGGRPLTATQLDNVLRYARQFQNDYAVCLIRRMLQLPDMWKRIAGLQSFRDWAKSNTRTLLQLGYAL